MEETSKNVVKLIRCIVCPTGCSIKVIGKDENNVEFEGYHCKRGLEYAEQEFREPKRILTTTIIKRKAKRCVKNYCSKTN